MRVTLLGHAETLIEAAGLRILIDPWLAEPVFAGAWYRYPPRPYRAVEELGRLDAVLLSHEHPDHAGVGTLELLPRDAPIFAMRFESPTLKRSLERAGRSDARFLDANATHTIGELRFTFVPHSEGWQVASIVVEAEGQTIYHGNDNALPLEGYREIARRFPRIDLALLPFAGASSYPTCFAWSDDVIREKGEAKKREGVQRLEDGVRGLAPRRAAPFASSWALLDPGSIEKNYVDRPAPTEAIAMAAEVARAHGTELLAWSPGDVWTPEGGVEAKGLSSAYTHDVAGVRRYAAARALTATPRAQTPRLARFEEATEAYLTALLDASRPMIRELSATIGLSSGPASFTMIFAAGAAPKVVRGVAGVDELLRVEPDDLQEILVGAWLWEDLWYGYRVHVEKRDGTPYFRAFWDALLFFDDYELKRSFRARFLAR